MIAVRRHYAGEGNSTRRITDAKRIQHLLHYKTERALPFNKFLDSLPRMFTIFEEENEPLTERAKVDKLLTKVQNTALAAAVAQLRYQLNTGDISFTVAAYHLNSEISQTTEPSGIREVKRRWFWQMTKKRVPKRLWDYSTPQIQILSWKDGLPWNNYRGKRLTYRSTWISVLMTGSGTRTMTALATTCLGDGLASLIALET